MKSANGKRTISIVALALVGLMALLIALGGATGDWRTDSSRRVADSRVNDGGGPVDEPSPARLARTRNSASDSESTEPSSPSDSMPDAPPSSTHLIIELQEPDGDPAPGFGLEVDYDMRRGSHGTDKGTTDSEGRFPTSAQLPFEIEDIRVVQGFDASLTLATSALATHPDRPHILVLKLPRLHVINVTVDPPTQPDGSNWAVWIENIDGLSLDPFVSVPIVDEYGGFYAAGGTLSMTVSEGHYSVFLSESDQEAIEVLVDRDPTNVLFKVSPVVDAAELPPPARTLIQGRVSDAQTGAGVRARVRMTAEPELPRTFGSWSDDDGSFEHPLPSRVRYVGASAPGYAFVLSGPIDASAPQALELRLEKAVRVAGRVVDRKGAPVTSGRVQLYRSNVQLQAPASVRPLAPLDVSFEWVTLDSDAGGAFSFEGVTDGPLRLRYEPYDPAIEPGDVLARGGDDDVAIVAGVGTAPTSSVKVRVTDASDGTPLNRVAVAVSDAPLAHYLTRRPEAGFTNEWGEAIVSARAHGDDAASGDVAVSVWILPRATRRYAALTIEGVRTVNGTLPLDVALEPATTVFLRVTDGGGAPIVGARLRAATQDGSQIHLQTPHGQPEHTTVTTSLSGRVDLRGVPTAGFSLEVEWRPSADEVPQTRSIEVDPTEHDGKLWTLVLD